MTSSLVAPAVQDFSFVKPRIDSETDHLIAWLPDPGALTCEQRRGIISRYTTVLEGNFIYWMTAAYLSVKGEKARAILLEDLREETRDCHPEMLSRFSIAAHATPTDSDAMAVREGVNNVCKFLGRMQGVQNILTIAFFENYIQRFMSYLAELAIDQGSTDLEYSEVHGVCNIADSERLLLALSAEAAINPPDPASDLFEGVNELSLLIQTINGTARASPTLTWSSVTAGMASQGQSPTL